MHPDINVLNLIHSWGLGIYAILFAIIFAETGLILAPFLPGDTLLFTVGALARIGYLDILVLFFTLSAASILGDSVNYWIGYKLGPKVFTEESKYFKKEYVLRAKEYYEKHGGRLIIFARFIPIVRTFAPFVAGVSQMTYRNFMNYNIVGGISWALIWLSSGYFFSGLSWVQNNFILFTIIIMILSFMPMAYEPLYKHIRAQLEVIKDKRQKWIDTQKENKAQINVTAE